MGEVDTGRSFERRDRAESFGADAESYDRARPDYPAAMITDLLADARPEQGTPLAVDVACGTGQLAAMITALAPDVEVVGVEVDPRMAAVARAKGLHVEVGPFETWAGLGRPADLLVCGQAWHWIDPVRGPRHAGDLLRPGGTLALAWNWSEPSDVMRAALDRAYRAAPSLSAGAVLRGGGPATLPGIVQALEDSGTFATVRQRQYERTIPSTTQRWIDLVGTHSDHRALPPGELDALQGALRRELDAIGGRFDVPYRTGVIIAVTR